MNRATTRSAVTGRCQAHVTNTRDWTATVGSRFVPAGLAVGRDRLALLV